MGRAPCCEKNGLKKGPWTSEEDRKLIDYIQKHGHGSWRTLPKNAGLSRCGKSCRLRWTNYLRPDIKRGRFSFDEEETIIQLHSILGNKWSAIAARLPGRTDNEIKNYWNTHIRKRLLRMGIDPVTHNPRLDLLDLSSLLTNPNLLFSPQAQFDISKLLGMESLQVNPDLLRIATSLLPSQTQYSNHFQLQNQFQHPQFLNINDQSQLMQPNTQDQFQPNVDQITNFGMNPNFPENLAPVTASSAENLDLLDPQLVLDDANFYLSSNQNYGNCMIDPVMSTHVSSPQTQRNSSSTYVSGGTEDEIDSYCSELLNFQVPDLLDVSDYM